MDVTTLLVLLLSCIEHEFSSTANSVGVELRSSMKNAAVLPEMVTSWKAAGYTGMPNSTITVTLVALHGILMSTERISPSASA